MVNSSWSLSISCELVSLAWLGVRQVLSSSVGEMGEVGDIEESSDTDVTELFDLSTCQWFPLPSVSSDPRDMSAIIPLSVTNIIVRLFYASLPNLTLRNLQMLGIFRLIRAYSIQTNLAYL